MQPASGRPTELDALLGTVPYLNGGLFDVHQLEEQNTEIAIPDQAFERLFTFFDGYQWHLDERPLRADNEINPDVLGYIFEKYVNQKQMGAYYTKEDITDYIGKNTILPFLFDAAEKKCKIAFSADSALWRLLRDDPDRYIYPAVRHGVDLPLPKPVAAGVSDTAKRDCWNQSAADGFALPTETWREHVARRNRCLEVRRKMAAGEVQSINDLVTFNLDIRQFAQDAIENCEGPELLRAFYHAIASVSVLDPTCGSGAFLFAALNILEPLYEACLGRMQAFLDELDSSREKASPKKYEDFRKTLAQVGQHPNLRYFILKSIIINNLYGVDIMEEAVEICKLRLFLKLVAQLETAGKIEPLPDIDFNIRAGNTLVGYVSLDEVRQAIERERGGQKKLAFSDAQDEVARIEEAADVANRAYEQFRDMQTEQAMDARQFAEAKVRLRKQLDKLSTELDRYLAGDYRIDLRKKDEMVAWQHSHQPFHWFAEFFGVMAKGGFSVVIGNPPYVELKVLNAYQTTGYTCEDAGNLYALVLERCSRLCSHDGQQGFIVPVSSISTDRYESLQSLLTERCLHYSSFDDRPSRLFDGLEHIRLTIHLIGKKAPKSSALWSTQYNKWSSLERGALFERLRYTSSSQALVSGTLPKLCTELESSIVGKLAQQGSKLADFFVRSGCHKVLYSRKVGYFLQVLDFEPRVLDGRGRSAHRRSSRKSHLGSLHMPRWLYVA